jgi:hypothetical protein
MSLTTVSIEVSVPHRGTIVPATAPQQKSREALKSLWPKWKARQSLRWWAAVAARGRRQAPCFLRWWLLSNPPRLLQKHCSLAPRLAVWKSFMPFLQMLMPRIHLSGPNPSLHLSLVGKLTHLRPQKTLPPKFRKTHSPNQSPPHLPN